MVKMTVPVTRGGNSLRIGLTKMPNMTAISPPASSAPRMAGRPDCPPMAVSAGT